MHGGANLRQYISTGRTLMMQHDKKLALEAEHLLAC